ncbi:MAG: chemotaxis protein CheW [Gemmatimonadota bacterium]
MTATLTPSRDAPAEPANAPAALLRFRDRVRARIGTAELLAFRLGCERFAFDVRALDEVLDAPPIDRIAGGDGRAIMVGLVRHAGTTIALFDAARLLVAGEARGAQVLVMRSGARRIALLVDDVDDVTTLDLRAIKPPPFDATDDLLLGVTWDHEVLTAILDARALISTCLQRSPGGVT